MDLSGGRRREVELIIYTSDTARCTTSPGLREIHIDNNSNEQVKQVHYKRLNKQNQ